MKKTFFELGNEDFDNEDFEEAIKHYEKAKIQESNNPEILYNLALSLYEVNDYQYSLDLSNDLIHLFQETSFFEYALFNRGNCYHKLKKYQNAIEDFTTLINLFPKDSSAYFNRANAREKLGDAKGAEDDRNKVKELELRNDLQRLYKAPDSVEIGDYSLDLFNYDKSNLLAEIESNPSSYSLYFELGNAYAKIRTFDKAIEYFQKAIELYPEDFYDDAYQNLIAANFDLKNYQRVIELSDNYLKKNINSEIVKSLRNWALEELSDNNK